MFSFQAADYGPVFQPLLEIDRRRSLGAGCPDAASRPLLKRLSVATAFVGTKVDDNDMALCCLSGIWLLHDFLDESHAVSQEIETPSGSYWHGVMHRREGDFSNAKYWFRRVGRHPVFEAIGPLVADLVGSQPGARPVVNRGEFDPAAMVDACQAAARDATGEEFCRRVQQLEWEMLFDHCFRAAIAR